MRYFLRCESDVPRVMLMRRENTLARYFTHLTESGLEDLGRAVIGRPEFRYIEGSLRLRISGQRESRRQVFVGPSTVPRSTGS
jgi:hypothetical protein